MICESPSGLGEEMPGSMALTHMAFAAVLMATRMERRRQSRQNSFRQDESLCWESGHTSSLADAVPESCFQTITPVHDLLEVIEPLDEEFDAFQLNLELGESVICLSPSLWRAHDLRY